MEQVIPVSWLNKILLIVSLLCVGFCLIIEHWSGLTSIPIYVLLIWSLIIIVMSTWFSFYLLKLSLKTNNPININLMKKMIFKQLEMIDNDENSSDDCLKFKKENLKIILEDINSKLIENWYKEISDEKTFSKECEQLLQKLLESFHDKIFLINKTRLVHKLGDILLLHLKEYRRTLRRVEKGIAKDVEDTYRYLHPGSRSQSALEHTIYRLVTILAREFFQFELINSLSCKLLLSILSKKILIVLQDASSPQWIFLKIISIIETFEMANINVNNNNIIDNNSSISQGLTTGINSATAPIISRSLNQSIVNETPIIEITATESRSKSWKNSNRISLCLDGLSTIGHKGLWNDLNDIQTDYDDNENHISPVYEETTDFATTIARLRTVLQQKSTASSPLHIEEKSYSICDGNQFMNLAIPWIEFHTSTDGSQQLYYCIQFDDVEQHGEDMFETTTATVKRQYCDFINLHKSLQDLPEYFELIKDINLPDGGRIEMENYLKLLCTKLSSDCPVQLRHFLRPNSGAGKKADAVAPRLDRFLAKTVTGVFNTLRTVVPGFEQLEQQQQLQFQQQSQHQNQQYSPQHQFQQEFNGIFIPTFMPLSDIPWRFIQDIKNKNLIDELKILLSDRIDYCLVDTAYEAVESIEGNCDSELISLWWETINYDEELDELDGKLTMSSLAIDIICELLSAIDSNNTLRQETIVRWTKLLIGNISESIIINYINKTFNSFNKLILKTNKESSYDNSNNESLEMIKKRLLNILLNNINSIYIKIIFGQNDVTNMIEFLLNSLEIKKVNFDLMLQIIDVFTSELLAAYKSTHVN